MKLDEVRNECQPGKWVPLLTIKTEDSDITSVPLFHDDKSARQFIKRNLPKEWLHGGVVMADDDLDSLRAKGLKLEEMSYPRRLVDIPGLTFGMEIHEFAVEPGFHVGRL